MLPLENLSRDPEQEYFADGMTEELIATLGKISALRVISRTSVMRYKKTDKPLAQIAKELNADAVIEGSVLRAGDTVRITAQMIHAASDRHLWGESYQRNLRDVLALQNEVARAVADQVKIKLTPQEQTRLSRSRSSDPPAQVALFLGRFNYNMQTLDSVRKSIKYFQQAIDEDPQYAEAYAFLAMAHMALGWPGAEAPSEAFGKAKAAALKALEIDESTVEAHVALGAIKFSYEWDWAGSEREFKRAIELNPSSSLAHEWYALYLSWVGRFDEALEARQRAFKLEPLSRIGFAMTYGFARRHHEAIREFQAELEISPESPGVHRMLAGEYAALKLEGQAVAECHKSRELEPSPYTDFVCAMAYATFGHREQAQKEFDKYLKAPYVDPYMVAAYYAVIDDKTRAFQWLEKAFVERSPNLCLVKVEESFDNLRSDPRYQDLLRRMNFPP